MTSLARNYARQNAIDAVGDAIVTLFGLNNETAGEVASELVTAITAHAVEVARGLASADARIANLKAALASVESRLDSAFSQGAVPHPLREELGLIRAAARGAIEADEREAKDR